jgi:predicted RNase H-like nuclease (RuvC/YqgF family)
VEKLIEYLPILASLILALVAFIKALSSVSNKSFKEMEILYDKLEEKVKELEIENKNLKNDIKEYNKSNVLMQGQMVTLNDEKIELEKKYQKREREIKTLLDNKDKEIEALKKDVLQLTRKVQLLERGTAPLPPRKV